MSQFFTAVATDIKHRLDSYINRADPDNNPESRFLKDESEKLKFRSNYSLFLWLISNKKVKVLDDIQEQILSKIKRIQFNADFGAVEQQLRSLGLYGSYYPLLKSTDQ